MEKKADGFQAEKMFIMPQYLVDEVLNEPLVRPFYLTDIGYYPRPSIITEKGLTAAIPIFLFFA
ncbi:hypothetical protein [Cohnella cholangitidis]|uniref:hypothetical protein n=1 Tax=Cohnella cholangitidis TaxID=2598458 RepID=UPI001E4BE104|nr:hypothetical protein [Cohnella cholangitidis]